MTSEDENIKTNEISGETPKTPKKKRKMSRKQSRKKSVSRKSIAKSQKSPIKSETSAAHKDSKLSPEHNPLEKIQQGIFYFSNQDCYIGEFMAFYPDTLVRQGLGIYLCSDGLIYKGNWVEDEFHGGSIQWPCGQCYTGPVQEGKYSGQGKYFLPGRGTIQANFIKNRPSGIVVFTDLAGLDYLGTVDQSDLLYLHPINHFFGVLNRESVFEEKKPEKKSKANEKNKKN